MCPILTTRRDGCANALIGKAGTAPISPSSSRRLIGPSQRFVASASSFDHLIGTGEEPVRNREAECMHRSMEGSINHSNLQQPGGILMEPPFMTTAVQRSLLERRRESKMPQIAAIRCGRARYGVSTDRSL